MRRSFGGPSPITGVTVLALRRFLEAKLGGDALQTIMHMPGYPAHHMLDFFDPRLTYEQFVQDAAVLSALGAVLEASGQPPVDTWMFEFGQFLMGWVTEEAGYQQLIGRVSDSFPSFAKDLNRLLAQQYRSLGGARPGLPDVQVSHVTPTSFVLTATVPETHSAAALMAPSVYLGFLDHVASRVFGLRAHFSDIKATPLGSGGVSRSCIVTFAATSPLPAPRGPGLALSPLLLDSAHDAHGGSSFPLPDEEEQGMLELGADGLDAMFPFHFVLDTDLRVLQAGAALKRVLPGMASRGTHIGELLAVTQPRRLSLSAGSAPNATITASLLAAGKVVFSSLTGPELCGCLRRVSWTTRSGLAMPALLFVGSPRVSCLQDMQRHDLYLSDFGEMDSPEHLLLAAAKQVRAEEALRQAQQANDELRARLVTVLECSASGAGAAREPDEQAEAAFGQGCAVDIRSAGQTLVQLLDTLLAGEAVTTHEVATARRALLRTGQDVWQPQGVSWSQSTVGDSEVNAALARMLGTHTLQHGGLASQAGAWFDSVGMAPIDTSDELLSGDVSGLFQTAHDLHLVGSCKASSTRPSPCSSQGQARQQVDTEALARAFASTNSGSSHAAGTGVAPPAVAVVALEAWQQGQPHREPAPASRSPLSPECAPSACGSLFKSFQRLLTRTKPAQGSKP